MLTANLVLFIHEFVCAHTLYIDVRTAEREQSIVFNNNNNNNDKLHTEKKNSLIIFNIFSSQMDFGFVFFFMYIFLPLYFSKEIFDSYFSFPFDDSISTNNCKIK